MSEIDVKEDPNLTPPEHKIAEFDVDADLFLQDEHGETDDNQTTDSDL